MELKEYCVLVIITILNIIKCSQSTQCTNSSFASFFNSLLAEYDRDVPPADTVTVGISSNVRHVTINEQEPSARFLADIYVDWTDTRLAWSSDEWACESTQVSGPLLYQPELRVLTLGFTLGAATDPLPVHVTAKGNVTMVMRMDISVPIALDLRNWPNYLQTFRLVLGSKSRSAKEQVLTHVPRKFNNMVESTGVWKYINADMYIAAVTGDFERDVATIEVHMFRFAPANALANGAVLVAALCSLVAALLLPPDGRAALCIAAAFIASIWLTSCLYRLPHALTTPLTLSLMGAVCVLAAIMSVAAAVTTCVAKQSGSPPAFVKRVVTAASEFCRLTPDKDTSSQAESGAWAATAKLLDRTLCSLALLALFIIFCVYFFSFVI